MENFWWLLIHKELNVFYYLYGFDRKNGPKQSDYMPYRAFRSLRDDSNRRRSGFSRRLDYICLLTDKFIFSQYLNALGFPTPKIQATCDGQKMYWLNTHRQEPYEHIVKHQPIDGFYKDQFGENGIGVYSLTVRKDIIELDDKAVTIDEFKKRIPGFSFIQERVIQHPKMAEVYVNSVNTIRLLTILVRGRPQPFSAFVRFGANGNRSDNWAVGGVLGRIDIEKGTLSKDFFFKPGYGGRIQRHPNSGVIFSGFPIPFYREAIAMALDLHGFFYGVHSIGWDIAITEQGPCFIEGNDNWEIAPFQLCEGGLKQRYLETLQE